MFLMLTKGLQTWGFECVKFHTLEDLEAYYHSRGELIVGGIGIIRKRLAKFDITPPTVDYPEELIHYLGRPVTEMSLSDIANHPEKWPGVFVQYGQILDCKHYWGDPLKFPSAEIIKFAIRDYTSAPDAYGIDFGVTRDAKTLLMEVNDAWALGCYGLEAHLYAKFLVTR